MQTVLYLAPPENSTCTQRKLTGTQQRLLGEGMTVRKITLTRNQPAEIADLIRFWDAQGLIIDCGGRQPPVSDSLVKKVPSVYLDLPREYVTSRRRCVCYDIRATCHLAARELLSLDCATYAYAGYGTGVAWSEERARVFAQALRLNGHSTQVFRLDPKETKPSLFYRRLTKWLGGLPHPVGILAADDAYALHVHSAAQNIGLRIPGDVAILGVDDESDLLATPGLSSIQLDFQEAGRQAAELLLEAIRDPTVLAGCRHFGPVQLLRRGSTRKLSRHAEDLSALVQRICEHATRGLTAAEAASWIPGSRRHAEIRFREAVGHSILEEITAARIDRAKELLSTVSNPIGEIAELCGYHTDNAFRDAFKAQTGLTPRAWRDKKRPARRAGPTMRRAR